MFTTTVGFAVRRIDHLHDMLTKLRVIVVLHSISLTDIHLWESALNVQNKTAKRVINGIPAQDGRVPWAGQMKATEQYSNLNNCGVTVISTQWLLTAAHCFYENSEYYPSQGGKILHFHIDQVILHPNFRPHNLLNDIALIKVRSRIPIDGTFIAIASLPPAGIGNNIPEAGSVNYVVGWGCMQGDSGSGLISFQTRVPMVVGIVSGGDPQRASSMPAKFTRVAPFVSWIRQYVG
ncbi:uncharacterized protein DEA37_0004114 [Paragonimus westermani]|uniref:Peptidase S1 domain-containing protein n=1 Tax=Paragonimus westermani TaxID=34504 RepID=A0A5J4NKL1_9TREM|nr:uncharacterized protein DEA37_0004114 [Paragonimus westermani]